MHIESMPVAALKPYTNNPRQNTPAVDKVAQSIEAFGFKQPIVVDKDHVIIVGHTRYLAAKQLKLATVPVLMAEDLSPEQASAYRLADNRTHEEATWEMDKLAEEIAALSQSEVDLSLTGFNARELAALSAIANQIEAGQTALHDCPAPSSIAVSQLGDIWQCGRHRLMCGDSTDLSHVMVLMGDVRADMVFTDPPYNVDYRGYTQDALTIANDQLSTTDFKALLENSFATCRGAVKPTASLYICYPDTERNLFEAALVKNGFAIRACLIWAKHHFAWGQGRYKYQHEPILYCHLQNQSDAWYGDKKQSTLWLIDKPHANRLHPTMKPIALIEKALKNSSREGDIILDMFGGSGSTLIACEKRARTAYLLELDPRYVDAIVLRWQAFTGQAAVLVSGDEPQGFHDVQAYRKVT